MKKRHERTIDTKAPKPLTKYEADGGPLATSQLRQIKKLAPQGEKHSTRSCLFDCQRAVRESSVLSV